MAAHLGVERGAVENNLDLLRVGSLGDALAINHDSENASALDALVVIADNSVAGSSSESSVTRR